MDPRISDLAASLQPKIALQVRYVLRAATLRLLGRSHHLAFSDPILNITLRSQRRREIRRLERYFEGSNESH